MDTTITGLVATAAPLLLAGVVFLRRNRPVLVFYAALVAVALGYLYTTGAVDDVGASVLDLVGGAGERAAPAR